MASTYELIVQAVDQTRKPLNNIDKNLQRLEKRSAGVTKALKGVGGVLAGIVTGRAASGIISITSEFEDLQDTLNSVTGSAAAGAKAFDFVSKFATQTQFDVADLSNTFIKLQGAGIKPTEKLLRTFTDAAAVTTDQVGTLEAITDLFSRTVSGGLGLEELNRLADRGIPAFKILEEQLGITRLEVSEFGKTADGAKKITEALARGINERFGGATQDKMDNLSTSMSNFRIAVRLAANNLGKEFRPQLTGAINDATKFITTNNELIKSMGVGLKTAIEGTAASIKFLADNFELIKNAALSVLFIQGAASAINFLKSINRLTGGVGIAALSFGKMTKAVGNVITKLPLIGTSLGTIGRVALRVAPLLTNPFTAIPTVIAGAVAGGLYFFRDNIIKVGETSARLGDVVKAVFNLIGRFATTTASNMWEGFKSFFNSTTSGISELGSNFVEGFKKYAAVAYDTANNILNAFVVAFVGIKQTIMNLPAVFGGVFTAIGSMATDFAKALGGKFSNLFEGLKMIAGGEFTAGFAKIGEDTGFSFMDSLNKALAEIPPVIPDVDVEGIMGVDRIGQAGTAIKDTMDSIATSVSTTISDMAAPLVGSVETELKAMRDAAAASEAAALKAEQARQLVALRNLEAAHGAEYYAQKAREAALAEEELKAASDAAYEASLKRVSASGAITSAMQQEILDLKDLRAALANASEIARMLGISESELTKRLQEQINVLTGNTEASTKNGNAKTTQLSVVQRLIKGYKDEKSELAQLENALMDVDKIAKANNITRSEARKLIEEEIAARKGLTQSTKDEGETIKDFSEKINDAIRSNADTLSSDMARSLAQGKNVLTDFKGFINRTLDDILTMIIQKNITDPLVAQLTGAVAGKVGGGGGLGGFLGSLLGGGMGGGGGGFSLGGVGAFMSKIPIIGGLFRANGGAVTGGKPYIVGERGSELFVPNTTGSIVPREELGGGNTANVTFNINAFDTKDAVQTLVENRDTITAIVSDSFNKQGRKGIIS